VILHDYFRVLRRRWWLIAVMTVVGIAGGALITALDTPRYYAQATVYVATVGDNSAVGLQQGNVFALQRAATYAELATTSSVLRQAAVALGDADQVEELRATVGSSARPETSLIDISASASDAEQAAARANEVADALTAEVDQLESPVTESPVQLTVVEAAETPLIAATPQPRSNVLIGAVVGFALGIALVVVAHTLDSRIHTLADLPRVSGLSTMTTIPSRRARRTRGVSAADARVESFRNLRANLQFGAEAGRCIAVAGVTGGSDAPSVARQLAAALGEIGSTVVVVNLDLRATPRGRRGQDQQVTVRLGVADVLAGGALLGDDVLLPGDSENVFILESGAVLPSSAQLLSTPGMTALLGRLRELFDYVILSCPPLVERSESAVAAALADSSLVVVHSGETTRGQFLFALELLEGVRVRAVSVVVDDVRDIDVREARVQTVESTSAA
jgi:capsular polysaccharide biosynthesis protein